MQELLIWGITIGLILIIVTPYFLKFRKKQKEGQDKQKEAIRLGADKAIAQHPQVDKYTCIGCGACVEACPEGDVLGIVSGKAVIVNGLKCVGHGKCAEACPVEGITIGLGDISQRDDIPYMSEHGETSIPGIFIAGELGGLALIKNAIAQGTSVVEHITQAKKSAEKNGALDVIIIGAGPAGMSAALTAAQNDLSYLLIDQQEAGGTILQYPRKKLVMTKPVELPLYGWLNQPEYSKEELLDIWQKVKTQNDLRLSTGEKLEQVTEESNNFSIKTSERIYSAYNVVLALGRRGTPRKLNVPGEHLPKIMYKLIDAENYNNEHLLVVGGGDSAIEAAMGLARQKNNTVTISYRKDKFFRIKKRNQERIDEFINEGKINLILNSSVLNITEENVTIESPDGEKKMPNNYVFIFAGGEPPFKLLKQIGIQFGGDENS
jgi:thioredoxin reductase (NADPH)